MARPLTPDSITNINKAFITILTSSPHSNLKQLDNWVLEIGERYKENPLIRDQLIEEDVPHGTCVLGKDFGKLATWRQIESSENRNDCLIHSFLICTSSYFRRFTLPTRDKIASAFRRKILPNLADFDSKTLLKSKGFTDNLTGGNFLSDDIGERLARRFGIGILFVQRRDKDRHMPGAEIKPVLDDDKVSIIVIHGTSAHFTPVGLRTNEPREKWVTASYMTTLDIAKEVETGILMSYSENKVSHANAAAANRRHSNDKTRKSKNNINSNNNVNLQRALKASMLHSTKKKSPSNAANVANMSKNFSKLSLTVNTATLTKYKSAYTRATKKYGTTNNPILTPLEQTALNYFTRQ